MKYTYSDPILLMRRWKRVKKKIRKEPRYWLLSSPVAHERMLFYWYTSMAFLLLQAIILPSNSPWTQKSNVSSNISNIEGGRRWLSCQSSGLSTVSYRWITVPFPAAQQSLLPAVLAPALPPRSRGFILVRMCKPSSGFGHSEPGDLHNGITAYSSITGHEYAKLLMLVTVIRLPWQVPSWGSFWAIYWQWGFSSWVSYFQLWLKGKTPQSATWNRGEQNSENGKNIFLELECFSPCHFPRRSSCSCWWDGMGHLALSYTLQQGLSLQQLFLSSLAAAHLKFGFKAKELREQAVVLKVVCPLAALGGLLALEGLWQCKAREFSRGLDLGGEMGNLNSQHLSSSPSLDKGSLVNCNVLPSSELCMDV